MPYSEVPCENGTMRASFIEGDPRRGNCVIYKENKNAPTQVETKDYYTWRKSATPPKPVVYPQYGKDVEGVLMMGIGSFLTLILVPYTIIGMIKRAPIGITIIMGLFAVGAILLITFGALRFEDANKESSDRNAALDAAYQKNTSDYNARKQAVEFEIYVNTPTI